LKSDKVCFVLTLEVLKLLQQGDGQVSRRAPLSQPGEEFPLPLQMSLALPDVASDHLQFCLAFHDGLPAWQAACMDCRAGLNGIFGSFATERHS